MEDDAPLGPRKRRRRSRERARRPVQRVERAGLWIGVERRAAVLVRIPQRNVTVRKTTTQHDEIGPVLLRHVAFDPRGRSPAPEMLEERMKQRDDVRRERSRRERPRKPRPPTRRELAQRRLTGTW